MKRFLLSLALVMVSTVAFGQAADHDVLVSPDGTVFTVETQPPSEEGTNDATPKLLLTVQNGSNISHMNVPGSVFSSFGGTLAYDSESRTLFVLWIRMPNAMSSELVLASYRDGQWTPAFLVDDKGYSNRYNLRLGITRRVSQLQKDGSYADVPALVLHAVWWEESGRGQEARYTALMIEKGAVSSIDIHALEEFVDSASDTYNAVDPSFNPEILRHPAIVSSPMQSSVDVVFGDTKNNTLHGVTLHPIADMRIHIPIGIGGGNGGGGPKVKPLSIAAPTNFAADWKGPITVLERGDRIMLANTGEASVSYITYSDGAWTAVKRIATSAKFPADAVISALDKMLSTQ